MDERDFFHESEETRPVTLHCPHCRQPETYDLRWVLRKKKSSLPPQANQEDRKRFAAARPYMVRRDDQVVCKNARCRKRFEVSGVQSVALL